VSQARGIFRLRVADTMASQSHEQVTRNAYVPEAKQKDAERFKICALSIGQS